MNALQVDLPACETMHHAMHPPWLDGTYIEKAHVTF